MSPREVYSIRMPPAQAETVPLPLHHCWASRGEGVIISKSGHLSLHLRLFKLLISEAISPGTLESRCPSHLRKRQTSMTGSSRGQSSCYQEFPPWGGWAQRTETREVWWEHLVPWHTLYSGGQAPGPGLRGGRNMPLCVLPTGFNTRQCFKKYCGKINST